MPVSQALPFDATVPAPVGQIGQAATGTETTVPRGDHVHDITNAFSATAAGNSAPGDVAATGSSGSANRRDHVHGRESYATIASNLKLDDLAAPDDNTDLNVSTSAHGLTPKLSNVATEYLDGTGVYSVPPGGGGAHASSHEDGGADEISIAALSGTPAELTNHLADATDAHDASAISFDDTGLTITAADVQTMGEQLDAAIAAGGIPATIVDVKGDSIWATAADTVVRVAAGANGTVPTYASGATAGMTPAFPPGYELDYAQITSPVTVTGTSIGATTDIVTGSSVAYDGSTIIKVEFSAPAAGPDPSAVGRDLRIFLFDGASEIGMLALMQTGVTQVSGDFNYVPIHASKRLTPSAASHTYSIKAFRSGGDGVVQAGAGTTSLLVPAYIRITKV